MQGLEPNIDVKSGLKLSLPEKLEIIGPKKLENEKEDTGLFNNLLLNIMLSY